MFPLGLVRMNTGGARHTGATASDAPGARRTGAAAPGARPVGTCLVMSGGIVVVSEYAPILRDVPVSDARPTSIYANAIRRNAANTTLLKPVGGPFTTEFRLGGDCVEVY